MDSAGNIYVTVASGVEIFNVDGARWGNVAIPRMAANCAFGDSDGRSLYVTARQALYGTLKIAVAYIHGWLGTRYFQASSKSLSLKFRLFRFVLEQVVTASCSDLCSDLYSHRAARHCEQVRTLKAQAL